MKPVDCPCGGARPQRKPNEPVPRYEDCCGRLLDGATAATDAVELMRSRYTAYVLGNTAYLRATWATQTCPHDLESPDNTATRWLGLQIKRHAVIDGNHQEVEFVARYKLGGKAHRLHETCRFTRDNDGRWRYLDGDIHE